MNEDFSSYQTDHKLFRIANDNDLEIEVLLPLLESIDELIRGAVVLNKKIPKDFLYKLEDDKSEYVQSCFRIRGVNI